ncbi:MAG: hypothetical protein ACKVTZ_11905 [Bacteroidia bacterium]
MKTTKTIKSRHDLRLLIQTLSKQEKRYFRLFSALQKGEKNYLDLFDAMSEQAEMAEAELKKKLKTPHLHTVKAYLFDHLLESLIQYEQNHNPHLHLRKEYIAAVVLSERLLFEAALIKLQKLLQQAAEVEDFGLMYDGFQLRKVVLRAIHADTNMEIWEEVMVEEQALLANMQACFEANTRLKYAYFDGYLRRDLPFLQEKIKEHGVRTMPQFQSKKAIYYHCTAMSFYHITMGQYREAYLFQQKMYEMFKQNKEFAHQNYLLYSECLLNYGYMLLAFREYEMMREIVEEQIELAKKLAYQSDLFLYRHLARTIIMVQGYMIESLKITENMAFLLAKWEEVLPQFDILLTHHQIFIVNKFAILYLMRKEPAQGLKMLKKLQISAKTEMWQHFLAITHVIQYLIHYELNDKLLLKSLVRAARRKKNISVLETVFLTLFHALTTRKNTQALENTAYQKALTQLIKFYEQSSVNIEQHPRFFVAWLQAKMKKSEVVVEMRDYL